MKVSMKKAVLLAWLVGVGAALCALAEDGPTSLTLLATSDVHGNIYNWDYYQSGPDAVGLTLVETIVKEERAKDPALLLLDAGDMLQGSPLVYYYNAKNDDVENPMAVVMNVMRYDAVTIGNHDYDFGQKVLDKFIGEVRFPVLSANIRTTAGAERYKPYLIKTVKGVRVGILGLTTTGIPSWENPANIAGLRFDDAVRTAGPYVARMKKEGAQVVVALVHSGPHRQPASESKADAWKLPYEKWKDNGELPAQNFVIPLAEQVPGIDVIVAGHSHLTIPQALVRGVLLVEPSSEGRGVSKVTLTVSKEGKVVDKQGEFLASRDSSPDQSILTIASPYQKKALAYLKTVIATAGGDFPGSAAARSADGPLVDLINVVQLEMARAAGHPADVSAATLFRNTAGIEKGPVEVSNVYNLYPYENTLWVIEITGAALRSALEHDARYWAEFELTNAPAAPVVAAGMKSYSWDMYSGIDYDLDLAKPVGRRVVKLQFKGQDVKPDQTLKLAINDYRAAGGGGFRMFKEAKVLWRGEEQIREAMLKYIAAKRTLYPRDYSVQNWRLLMPAAAGKP